MPIDYMELLAKNGATITFQLHSAEERRVVVLSGGRSVAVAIGKTNEIRDAIEKAARSACKELGWAGAGPVPETSVPDLDKPEEAAPEESTPEEPEPQSTPKPKKQRKKKGESATTEDSADSENDPEPEAAHEPPAVIQDPPTETPPAPQPE